MKFEVALTNSIFTSNYENVMRFNSKQEQEAYFKISTLFPSELSVNFTYGSLLKDSITLKADGPRSDLLGYNYLIVKESENRYLYYFIIHAEYEGNNTATFDIELDIFNTYYLQVDFSNCVINRAHLNRFFKLQHNLISFDCSENSKLFDSEPIEELPKRNVSRETFEMQFMQSNNALLVNGALRDWVNKNVAYWVYIFIDRNHNYKVENLRETAGTTTTTPGITELKYNFDVEKDFSEVGVICYPVFKTQGAHLYITKSGNIKINISPFGLINFRNANNDTSFFYNMKLSQIPPIELLEATEDQIEINNERTILTLKASENYDFASEIKFANCYAFLTSRGASGSGSEKEGFGLITGINQTIKEYKSTRKDLLNKPFQFAISDIVGGVRDKKYNPKLYNSNFLNIKICDCVGNSFDYDLQKMGTNAIFVNYSELLDSTISKYYLRLNPEGLYSQGTNYNYVGLVGSNDTSILFSNTKYADFIANNKNFWLQSVGKIITNTGAGAIGGAIAGKGAGAIAGALGGGITHLIDTTLQVDNMKQGPNSITNASGSIRFNTMITNDEDFGIKNYLEVWEALPQEVERADDFMYLFGFSYNQIDNIKNVDNIRKYFNYVQAEVQNIIPQEGINLPNEVREIFKAVFARGVRFWNNTNNILNFKYENYENWLEV